LRHNDRLGYVGAAYYTIYAIYAIAIHGYHLSKKALLILLGSV